MTDPAPQDSTNRPSDFVEHGDVLLSLADRMGSAVGTIPDDPEHADAFVGFFQAFRPDGNGLVGTFDCLPCGDELHRRLDDLFEVAGDDRRPQGGRDAYFVVRSPRVLPPRQTEDLGNRWLRQMRELADRLGHGSASESLASVERVRVLEGSAPKHPRQDDEKTGLLKLLQQEIPNWLADAFPDNRIASMLRPPYYFIHCDPMLRDYLLWPIYNGSIDLDDPFEAYFDLWRHGVKWRVFQETQLDLYLPRHP